MGNSSSPPAPSSKPRKAKRRFSLKVMASGLAGAIGAVALFLSNLETIRKFFTPQRSDSGISLIVSVADLKPPPQEENAIDTPYRQEVREDGWLEITPDGKYFQALRSGALLPVHWSSGELINVSQAGVDIRLVNNSGKVIVPHEITLELAKSRPDNSPLLYPVQNPSDLMSISFYNEGWGEITGMDIAYTLEPASAAGPIPSDLPHHAHVERPVDGVWQFFITDAMIREGAPEALTRQLQTLESRRRPDPDSNYDAIEPGLKKLRETGGTWGQRFGLRNPAVEGINVSGKVTCSWRDYDNSVKTREYPFRALAFFTIPDGLGAGTLEPAAEVGFELPIQADNLRLSKPLSRVLSGADADRYTVTLFSKQSAVHEFRLRVRYDANNEAVSNWIRFHFLLPTSIAELKQQPDFGPNSN